MKINIQQLINRCNITAKQNKKFNVKESKFDYHSSSAMLEASLRFFGASDKSLCYKFSLIDVPADWQEMFDGTFNLSFIRSRLNREQQRRISETETFKAV